MLVGSVSISGELLILYLVKLFLLVCSKVQLCSVSFCFAADALAVRAQPATIAKIVVIALFVQTSPLEYVNRRFPFLNTHAHQTLDDQITRYFNDADLHETAGER